MVLNFKQLENYSSYKFDVKNVKDPRDNYSIPAGNNTNRHDAWLVSVCDGVTGGWYIIQSQPLVGAVFV